MKTANIEISTMARYANEALILAILSKGDRHGYQIAIEVEEESGGLFSFNHGTLYPILHKLEKEGLIKGLWKREGTNRKRKYYSITAEGKHYFSVRRTEWNEFFGRFFKIIGR